MWGEKRGKKGAETRTPGGPCTSATPSAGACCGPGSSARRIAADCAALNSPLLSHRDTAERASSSEGPTRGASAEAPGWPLGAAAAAPAPALLPLPAAAVVVAPPPPPVEDAGVVKKAAAAAKGTGRKIARSRGGRFSAHQPEPEPEPEGTGREWAASNSLLRVVREQILCTRHLPAGNPPRASLTRYTLLLCGCG